MHGNFGTPKHRVFRVYCKSAIYIIETAEKMGDCACLVRGVESFDDVLNAKIAAVTEKAKACGIREGMTGREALNMM